MCYNMIDTCAQEIDGYECLSEARASHAHKTWTEVSSSVPHFLQMGLLLSPITYKCRLRVLCPVRRPMTNLDCVLLKEGNCALVAKLGLVINSWACLCVLQGPCHILPNAGCPSSILSFFYVLSWDPQERLWSH